MTNLGGHCMQTLVDAFEAADDETPTLFIAYTIKGYGLPFAGHKDNHAGLMNPAQVEPLRDGLGIADGTRVGAVCRARRQRGSQAAAPSSRRRRWRRDATAHPPPGADPRPARRARRPRAVHAGGVRSHPARALQVRRTARRPHRHHLARRHRLDQPRRLGEPARAVPPPGAQGRVPRRQDPVGTALVGASARASTSSSASPSTTCSCCWPRSGCPAPLFGTRLLPIGTVYDPFIARGLDALNYGCYQDAASCWSRRRPA